MIDRSIVQAIVGALPDEKIMQILKVAGLTTGDQMDGGLAGMSVDNKIQPWSAKKVTGAGDASGKPALVDKAWMARPEEADMGAALPGVSMAGVEAANPFLSTASKMG